MALHTNKAIKKLMRELLREGWQRAGEKRHTKMRSPGGHLVSFSSSPSCPFAVDHIRKDVQRIRDKEAL